MEKEMSQDYLTGLDDADIEERMAQGKVNGISKPVSKTYWQIFKENVCTLFNLLNFLIFIALLLVGAWSNLVFMAIIVCNAVIGMIQEIKAKHLVDQLAILTKPTIRVVRNQQEQMIDISDVVVDDVLVLTSGSQVCNDAIVINGSVDTNESLLTGEVDPVNKEIGALLLSGSSVISGKCYARVKNVGENNYATTLIKEAQKAKENSSELMNSMKKVTKITTFMIIPLGILLFIEALYLRQDTLFNAVVTGAAGLLGMLPKGLVLLTSVSLANGVGNLAKEKVLVQDLYSLETLSHVDVLCLDKTGTITDGKMKVEQVFNYTTNLEFDTIMGAYLKASDDNNATFKAMQDYYQLNDMYTLIDKIPFSSLQKWSAVEFEQVGTIVVGAVEKIVTEEIPVEVKKLMDQGMRVIAVGLTQEKLVAKQTLPPLQLLAILILSDTIRAKTKETLAYFHQEGIETKIISGDNLNTVKAIAKKAGVLNYQKALDLSTLEDEDIFKVASDYNVFARVTPKQKKLLVTALKQAGHQVAMTGDGVNDLLALKEADCSIAIADGSDASKQISQVVLLNSDFACLPKVLLEGRKVVNNVTRVASVFFIKTIYTVLLAIFCVIMNQPFPFIPLQITLIDFLIEAMPSFMTIFEADTRKINGAFLPKVIRRASSSALSIVIMFVLIMLLNKGFKIGHLETITMMYLVLGFVSMAAVLRSCYPFTKLRIAICSLMIGGFMSAVLFFNDILHLVYLDLSLSILLLFLVFMALIFERIIYYRLCKRVF